MKPFWHKPESPFIDTRWHRYTEYGEGRLMTICGALAIFGQGKPKSARQRMPERGRCGKCLKLYRASADRRGANG